MESWRMIAWLITIGAVIVVLAFLIIPPIVWWVYKRSTFPFEERYRTFWPRLWASWIDVLVLMPAALLFSYLLHPKVSLWETARWMLVIVYIINQTYFWFYSIYMHGRWGQTVGKMTTRVKVVDLKTEKPISYFQALLRDSIPILISLPFNIYVLWQLIIGSEYPTPSPNLYDPSTPASGIAWVQFIAGVWWFAEIVTMLTNEKRRALHDFIAGTVVVRTNVEEENAE